MGRCYDDICRFLRSRNIAFMADPDRTECWTNLGIREGIRLEVSFRAVEQMSAIFIRSVFPRAIPDEMLHNMCTMIARANYGLGVGCFELDLDDGELAFRTSILADPDAPTPDVVLERTLGVNLGTHAKYWPAFMKVLYGNEDVESALMSVENQPADANPLSDDAFAAFMERMMGGVPRWADDPDYVHTSYNPVDDPDTDMDFEDFLDPLEDTDDEEPTSPVQNSGGDLQASDDLDDDPLAHPGGLVLYGNGSGVDPALLDLFIDKVVDRFKHRWSMYYHNDDEDEDDVINQLNQIDDEMMMDPALRNERQRQIGAQLQRVRDEYNLSIAEMADQLQVTTTTMRRWMNGGKVRADLLSRLVLWLRTMGCSI